MSAYSQDLRQRVIDTVERGEGSLRRSRVGSSSASPSSLGCCDTIARLGPSNPSPIAGDGLRLWGRPILSDSDS